VTAAAIEVAGLTKSFGRHAVLRGVDLAVARGSLVGLVGQNGAGKSTLLRALTGLCRRDGGTVRVLGIDPAQDGVGVRRLVSYLPGETSVYQQMTGRQFLDFALSFHGGRPTPLLERLLAGFDLPLQQRVRSYSAGMKQKLAIAATLAIDADLYLLDEPDRALDAAMRFFLRELLLALKAAGKTILLSSHHLSEVESLADRLEFLAAGRFVPQDRLDAARAQLRARLRLRLRPGAAPPDGARELLREPDGTRVLATDGDPIAVLRALPPGAVLAAEAGTVHLEDLYRLLLGDDARPPEPAP
jgi:ABC-2 type transport system ATP-binding protein